ncbi:acyl-homoserine-lactone synthase [Ensifer sp. ENS11]|uniref:acyl-homoserine-lactone synthase n=1 Tax=Ensifer sp. ENS11 TaxID=2769291 RepID=UPI0017873963|nr:acyl-homoserine-lactone synthase [Ensifer sp. ENS11]MBD9489951.1 GNAT family N-acetyltransferase [Ensifer sp. ENS11]
MKIIQIQQPASPAEALLLEEMYRLRGRVFAERLGWNVRIENGREIDRYDRLAPLYILAVTPRADVVGCARLLPTSGPTMLTDTFAELLPPQGLATHAHQIESSRFCVDTSRSGGGGSLHEVTRLMLAGIVGCCLVHGFTEVVTATDVAFERILRRAGWPLSRLGEPRLIGTTLSIAGKLQVNQEISDRLQPPACCVNFSRLRWPVA